MLSDLWKRIKKAFAPIPLCDECGEHWSDIGHQSWNPDWPIMPGKEPVDHWYVNPQEKSDAH